MEEEKTSTLAPVLDLDVPQDLDVESIPSFIFDDIDWEWNSPTTKKFDEDIQNLDPSIHIPSVHIPIMEIEY